MKKSELKKIIREELLKEVNAWKYSQPFARLINKLASDAENVLLNKYDIKTVGWQSGKKQIEKARLEMLKAMEKYFNDIERVL
jgi:hypothetical protein